MLKALDGRLNSPAGLRVLLLVFLGSAAVFSALPLLRYLRGHTIFDYELWYATGKRGLAGDEIFFFGAGKYDFMYPPPCALFLAGAALLGQGGLNFLSRRDQLRGLVLQRETERFCILNNKRHTRDQVASCLAKQQ